VHELECRHTQSSGVSRGEKTAIEIVVDVNKRTGLLKLKRVLIQAGGMNLIINVWENNMDRPEGPQTEEDKDQVLFLAMVVIIWAVTGFNRFFEWGFSLAYFAVGLTCIASSDWISRLLGLIPLGLGGVGIYALIFHDFSFRR
jgi:hypothetical protein